MNRNKMLVLFAVVATGAGAAALAAQGSENDALAIVNARVNLVDAVAVAQQHASGRATRAEFEHAAQGWVYDVEVVSGSKVYDVRVDATKGTVISSVEDKADRDGEHGKEDKED